MKQTEKESTNKLRNLIYTNILGLVVTTPL